MDIWSQTFSTRDPRPIGRPLLIVSGICGDLLALDAVLGEAQRSRFSAVLAVGNHCFGGPSPFETWARLQDLEATLIRGDLDVVLGEKPDDRRISDRSKTWQRSWYQCREALGDILVRRLVHLPTTAVVSLDGCSAGVMAVHQSPFGLLETAAEHDLRPEILVAETACVAEDVLVMAADTKPLLKRMGNVLVINMGALGRYCPEQGLIRSTAYAVLIQEFSDGMVRGDGRVIGV